MTLDTTYTDYCARMGDIIAKGGPSPEDFNRLALELFALQFEANQPLQKLCRARGTEPGSLSGWRDIPALPAAAFKEADVTTLPPTQRTHVFHSSGTTDQTPSRHYHNEESLALYETSLKPWFKRHVLKEATRPVRFGLLTPRPMEAPQSSLVHMFETVTTAFGSGDSEWLGRLDGSHAWTIDSKACFAFLQAATEEQTPVVLLGTAFLFVHLLDELNASNQRIILPPGSVVMETGGYKGRSRELSREQLHRLIGQQLGVGEANIVREYGMSELSSQAYARNANAFLFPPWARAQIISPETGREAAEGETGLIRLFDLANLRSVAALQTEDLGIRRGVGFELLGRASIAEPRGCSRMTL